MSWLIEWFKKLLGLEKKPAREKLDPPPDLSPPPLFRTPRAASFGRSAPQFFGRETTYRTDPAPDVQGELMRHMLWTQMMEPNHLSCTKPREDDLARTEEKEGYDSGHNAPLPANSDTYSCPQPQSSCEPINRIPSPAYSQDHSSSWDSSSSSFDSSSSSFDSSSGDSF